MRLTAAAYLSLPLTLLLSIRITLTQQESFMETVHRHAFHHLYTPIPNGSLSPVFTFPTPSTCLSSLSEALNDINGFIFYTECLEVPS